jgi:hypothetical protein
MADVVAETTDVVAERTRLPRLRSLVMGGGATGALVALVALVVPNVGTSASSAPGHAPELQVPELSASAPPPDVLERVALRAVKREVVNHEAATVKTFPRSPSPATHTAARAAQAPTESHVVSNVQDSAPTNVNNSSQTTANGVAVTTANKHVNSNRSVNVSNSTVQKVTSGSVQNSVHVSSSVKVSRSHTYFQSSP